MEEIGVRGWDRMEGEPTLWHERFEIFRGLGPKRSVAEAYRVYMRSIGQRPRPRFSWWERAARRWRWRERAAMWDDAERRRLRMDEQAFRTQAYYERVELITRMLRAAVQVFAAAGLDRLEAEEARKLIPSMRPLFRDMLSAYREEVGPLEDGDGERARLFSVDELGKAIAETRALMHVEGRAAQEWRVTPGGAWSAMRDALAHLYPERADVHRVAEEAGLNVRRIDMTGAPLVVWEAVLREARHAGLVDAVLEVASREYGSYGLLKQARAAWERDREREGLV